MRLAPRELEKLILHNAGALAQKRYARGLKLNYVEAIALIASQLHEFIREGHSVAELMDRGKKILGHNDVLPNVPGMIHEVQVEGTFPDGTKLVTVHDPVCRESGDSELALHGSGLTRTAQAAAVDNSMPHMPGEVIPQEGDIVLNEGRRAIILEVTNRGDRPIQVGSHYPFFEVNPELHVDRESAYGYRLNVPAGAAVRFEPGETKTVELVEIAGDKMVYGGHGLIAGQLGDANKAQAMQRAKERGFAGADDE